MASGYTFVQAINEIVEVVGEFPMSGTTKPSALGTPDITSNYARAEQFIDRYSKRVQAQGWPENTTFAKKFTSAQVTGHTGTSGFKITIPNSVLRVKAAGPDEHRSLVVRFDADADNAGTDVPLQRLYDANNQSHSFGTAATEVYVDVVEELIFDNLSVHLQDVIIGQAKMAFQRRLQGNLNMDQALSSEYIQSEAQAPRNAPELDQPFNTRPMIPGAGGSNPKPEK
jgi:hypothetical protein